LLLRRPADANRTASTSRLSALPLQLLMPLLSVVLGDTYKAIAYRGTTYLQHGWRNELRS